MYIIYEGNLTPGSLPVATDPNFQGSQAGQFKLPLDCLYLNIYNISPHRLTFSFSGGQNDWYFPPNSEAEGIYIGKQGGAELSIAQKMQSAVQLAITNLFFLSNQASITGILAVMGFKEGELWQGKRPLITGSIVPTQGLNIANQLINNGNPPGTSVISVSSNEPNSGGIFATNDGRFQISLLSNGTSKIFELFNAGTLSTPAAIQIGSSVPADLTDTILYGQLSKLYSDGGALQSSGTGELSTVGNQAAANGNFAGVPVIVSYSNPLHVTALTLTTILSFTPTATGFYRATIGIFFNNTTNEALTASLGWTDGSTSTALSTFFQNAGTLINGVNVFTRPNFIAGVPITFYAVSGTPILIKYQDPAAAPSDWVTATIERLT